MFTSYFANLRQIESPLSIARFQPKWYDGPRFTMLAPEIRLLTQYRKGGMSVDEYEEEYRKDTLARLRARDVYDWIVSNYSSSAVLLCYEKPGQFCHRRLVAKWFEKELGVYVPELESMVRRSSLQYKTRHNLFSASPTM